MLERTDEQKREIEDIKERMRAKIREALPGIRRRVIREQGPEIMRRALERTYADIPGEIGKEVQEAFAAYVAHLPFETMPTDIKVRYKRIEGSLYYIRFGLGLRLNDPKIGDMKLADLPGVKEDQELERTGKVRTNSNRPVVP